MAYVRVGNLARAMPDLNEGLRLDPTDPAGYLFRGCAFLAIGEFCRAAGDANEAIRLAPKYASAYVLRAERGTRPATTRTQPGTPPRRSRSIARW